MICRRIQITAYLHEQETQPTRPIRSKSENSQEVVALVFPAPILDSFVGITLSSHCFLKLLLSFLIGCWGYSRFGLYDTQSNSILFSHADFTKLTIVTIEETLFSILLIFESSLKLLIFTWTEKKIGCQPEEKKLTKLTHT